MKNKIIISIAALLSFAAPALAQDSPEDFLRGFGFFGFGGQGQPQETKPEQKKIVNVLYDVGFEYYFDNRENDVSDDYYSPSMTINSARLTPAIGLEVAQKDNLNHRLMLGIDIQKNMGESPTGDSDKHLMNWDLFKEITMYYRTRWQDEKNIVTGYAGIFPRNFCGGRYSTAFLSDSLRYFNNNLEGVMLQWERPKGFYEIGCDWLGMYGSRRREKFIIYSYGEGSVFPWMSAGWTFNGFHYANAKEYGGVVDNNLAQVFIRFDLTGNTGFQDLSTKISFLQAFQRDRESGQGYIRPNGIEHELNIRRWNVGIDNRLYIGASLMPYYSNIDSGGNKYGSSLYLRDPYYRIHRSGDISRDKNGGYDRLEAYFQPRISSFLDLKLSVVFHFAGDFKDPSNFGFAGWQQKFSLLFSLDRLTHPKRKIASPSFSRSRTEGSTFYL